jgi:hypothetical protein
VQSSVGSQFEAARDWLPVGKRAAVVLTVDDVHPATSDDAYEAGGDLGKGALRHVEWLTARHPDLQVTLFTTPDWREIRAHPSRRLASRVPILRERMFLTPILPKGTMRVDRHPSFVDYLNRLTRVDVAIHGLHHVHRGRAVPMEIQGQDVPACRALLAEARSIFESARLAYVPGFQPPAWNVTPALVEACIAEGIRWIAGARDVRTAVEPTASAKMSGPTGLPLCEPSVTEAREVVHFTTNFQATSSLDRAIEIVEVGGLVAMKAHIVKNALDHVSLDGLDEDYRNHLDSLFFELERRFGDAIWWTSLDDIASRVVCDTP